MGNLRRAPRTSTITALNKKAKKQQQQQQQNYKNSLPRPPPRAKLTSC